MKYLPNPDGSPKDSWIERQPPEPPEDAPIQCPQCRSEGMVLDTWAGWVRCPLCRGLGTVYEEELK